ncbi:MAG: TIGR01212 family radical SAM protein [Lachnospiraceae bacterium]|nr:TIGR01212 family radical SAM protein [Lachnospiraceae bacterium]
MEHRPYYSANMYYRELFHEKVYKISLNAGLSCPNRDGLINTRGCIFCSAGGSGDFAADPSLDISSQLNSAVSQVASKYTGNCFIAYYQAYTNTYAPVGVLKHLYAPAVNSPDIVGISIATRPDCLNDDVIALLADINRTKPVWVELGLQTIDDNVADYIRRGYPLSVYESAVSRLCGAGINFITHVIIGLPGVSHDGHIECARYLGRFHNQGIKLQLLHVLKGTDLASDYESGRFNVMEQDEYVKTVVDMIEVLPEDIVIHRITGDGPKNLLIAPKWSTDKKRVLNSINKEFRIRNTYQGKRYRDGG